VLARISERLGLRFEAEAMLRGMETVKGREGGWYSVMDILTSSSSGSTVEVVGEEAVEEDVRMDKGCIWVLREFMMPLRSCL
jgi:hypothetical protein